MSNDKTAEEIERERIAKDADKYLQRFNWRPSYQDVESKADYIAGATHEFNRSAQQLKEYREVIRELLPFVEESASGIVSISDRKKYRADLLIERARKLIDQTDSTK